MLFGGETYDGFMNDTYWVATESSGLGEWRAVNAGRPGPSLIAPSVCTAPARFRYSIPVPGRIRMRIVDATGAVVRELFAGRTAGATGWLEWDGRDKNGRSASAGSYFCHLETDDTGVSKRFVLAR
jgi:hypothetical protein